MRILPAVFISQERKDKTNPSKMRIKYITNVRIPTSRAQGYAIAKMCSEFAKTGAEVELFVPSRVNNKNKFYNKENSEPRPFGQDFEIWQNILLVGFSIVSPNVQI